MRASFLALAVAACGGSHPALPDAGAADAASDAAPDAPPVAVTITSTVNSTRFAVRDHMLASAEMQISGEPLAEAMGRNLGGYSRNLVPVDIYVDPVGVYGVDLAGFSTAVESYEYSKQPMNNLAFEAGAGTSLAHAPLVNGLVGTSSLPFVQQFAERSNAWGKWVFPAGTFPQGNAFGDVNPTGAGTGDHNPIGWPGMWPTAHVFASFDPAIDATGAGTSSARSPPMTIRTRAAACSSAATTSATRRACTCATARRRSSQSSRPAPTDSRRGSTACGRSTTFRSCTTGTWARRRGARGSARAGRRSR